VQAIDDGYRLTGEIRVVTGMGAHVPAGVRWMAERENRRHHEQQSVGGCNMCGPSANAGRRSTRPISRALRNWWDCIGAAFPVQTTRIPSRSAIRSI